MKYISREHVPLFLLREGPKFVGPHQWHSETRDWKCFLDIRFDQGTVHLIRACISKAGSVPDGHKEFLAFEFWNDWNLHIGTFLRSKRSSLRLFFFGICRPTTSFSYRPLKRRVFQVPKIQNLFGQKCKEFRPCWSIRIVNFRSRMAWKT